MKRKVLVLISLVLAMGATSARAQLNVGSTSRPNADAMLQVSGGTKGFLFPQVALVATNLASPLSAHVAGMAVYNTAIASSGTAWVVVPGIYVNDGARWNLMASVSVCQNDISQGSGQIVQMMYDNTGGGTASYGWCARTVTGPDGLTWLDRNLGAYEVATSSTDAASYGSLYQWGRNTDGHQWAGTGRGVDNATSGTTTTVATTDAPGNVGFIVTYPADWRSDNNNNRWNSVSGSGASLVQANNPCPAGYHVPTTAQLTTLSSGWRGSDDALASTLKLPLPGIRNFQIGSFHNVDSYGYYWSSTPDNHNSSSLWIYSSNVAVIPNIRGNGLSVRCLQN